MTELPSFLRVPGPPEIKPYDYVTRTARTTIMLEPARSVWSDCRDALTIFFVGGLVGGSLVWAALSLF